MASWLKGFLNRFAAEEPAPSDRKLSAEQLEKLEQSGAFKPQYVIPLQLGAHPMLALLASRNLFDIHSDYNQLMLPVEADLAAKLGISRYAETPLDSYMSGVEGQLDRCWASAQATGVSSGNEEALNQLAADVVLLRDTVKAGLVNGDVVVSN